MAAHSPSSVEYRYLSRMFRSSVKWLARLSRLSCASQRLERSVLVRSIRCAGASCALRAASAARADRCTCCRITIASAVIVRIVPSAQLVARPNDVGLLVRPEQHRDVATLARQNASQRDLAGAESRETGGTRRGGGGCGVGATLEQRDERIPATLGVVRIALRRESRRCGLAAASPPAFAPSLRIRPQRGAVANEAAGARVDCGRGSRRGGAGRRGLRRRRAGDAQAPRTQHRVRICEASSLLRPWRAPPPARRRRRAARVGCFDEHERGRRAAPP